MGQIANSKDLLMLLLYAKGKTGKVCEPIVGRTRLMKMVFLFDEEVRKKFDLDKVVPESVMPKFEAYDYGPFSAKVYDDLEFLVNIGFVEVAPAEDNELLPDEEEEYGHWQALSGDEDRPYQERFLLTDLGRRYCEKRLKPQLTEQQWDILEKFKNRCTSVALHTLLKYVYARYPDKITKSKIRDQVLGR